MKSNKGFKKTKKHIFSPLPFLIASWKLISDENQLVGFDLINLKSLSLKVLYLHCVSV